MEHSPIDYAYRQLAAACLSLALRDAERGESEHRRASARVWLTCPDGLAGALLDALGIPLEAVVRRLAKLPPVEP